MTERTLEDRIAYIKDMARVLGFRVITDGDMGDYRYLRFEDSINSEKKMITIHARIYSDNVETEMIFEKNPIKFNRDVKMNIKEALDVATLIDGLYDWLNRVVYD